MKKFIVILAAVAISLTGMYGRNKTEVPSGRLSSFVNEYRHCDGVELVRVGRLGTAVIKTVIRMGASGDEDTRQALDLIKGVRRLCVLNYEEAAPDLRLKMTRKLDHMLSGSEMLMEVKDGEDMVRMYGITDSKGTSVRDFVLYVPGDCTLICIFGSISMDAVGRMMESED